MPAGNTKCWSGSTTMVVFHILSVDIKFPNVAKMNTARLKYFFTMRLQDVWN